MKYLLLIVLLVGVILISGCSNNSTAILDKERGTAFCGATVYSPENEGCCYGIVYKIDCGNKTHPCKSECCGGNICLNEMKCCSGVNSTCYNPATQTCNKDGIICLKEMEFCGYNNLQGGICYNPEKLTCDKGKICPIGMLSCKGECYDPKSAICVMVVPNH